MTTQPNPTMPADGSRAATPQENDSNSTYCEACGCRITQGRCSHGVRIPLRENERRPDETQAQFFRRLERGAANAQQRSR